MGRKKAEKRTLTFYKIAYGFTPTYKVLVHPELVRVSIRQQINLRDQLPRVLHDKAVPCTTKCVLHSLRTDDDTIGAAVLARKFQMIACSHQKVRRLEGDKADQSDAGNREGATTEDDLILPDACISEVLARENAKPNSSLVVATSITQNAKISREKYYKTPFVLLKSAPYVLTVLPAAERAQKLATRKEQQTRTVPEHEQKILAEEEEGPGPLVGKKRKRKKEPNPLSMKKKKHNSVGISPGEEKVHTTKRKTRRRKKPKKNFPPTDTENQQPSSESMPVSEETADGS